MEQAAGKWQTLHKDEKVSLEPVSYDEIEDKIQNNELDAVLVNSRYTIYQQLATSPVDKIALVALVQAGNFNKYQQTVEVSDLKNLPCIMVAGVEEEKSEYHYLKGVLQVDSDLLAVETLGEAVLMVESGSGYLIMNEKQQPTLMMTKYKSCSCCEMENNSLKNMLLLLNQKISE